MYITDFKDNDDHKPAIFKFDKLDIFRKNPSLKPLILFMVMV